MEEEIRLGIKLQELKSSAYESEKALNQEKRELENLVKGEKERRWKGNGAAAQARTSSGAPGPSSTGANNTGKSTAANAIFEGSEGLTLGFGEGVNEDFSVLKPRLLYLCASLEGADKVGQVSEGSNLNKDEVLKLLSKAEKSLLDLLEAQKAKNITQERKKLRREKRRKANRDLKATNENQRKLTLEKQNSKKKKTDKLPPLRKNMFKNIINKRSDEPEKTSIPTGDDDDAKYFS